MADVQQFALPAPLAVPEEPVAGVSFEAEPAAEPELEPPRECKGCKIVKPANDFHRDSSRNKHGRRARCRECVSLSNRQKKSDVVLESPVPVTSATCTRCNEEKPAGDFTRNARNPTGLNTICKLCRAQHPKPRVLEPQVTHKVCAKCKEDKPAADYPRDCCKATGLNVYCKLCLANRTRQRREVRPPVDEPTVEEKRCPRCDQVKPATDFFKNKATRTGLASACKDCFLDRDRELKRKREPVMAPTVDHKICNLCRVDKPASEFFRSKENKTGLRRCCRECDSRKCKERRQRRLQRLVSGDGSLPPVGHSGDDMDQDVGEGDGEGFQPVPGANMPLPVPALGATSAGFPAHAVASSAGFATLPGGSMAYPHSALPPGSMAPSVDTSQIAETLPDIHSPVPRAMGFHPQVVQYSGQAPAPQPLHYTGQPPSQPGLDQGAMPASGALPAHDVALPGFGHTFALNSELPIAEVYTGVPAEQAQLQPNQPVQAQQGQS